MIVNLKKDKIFMIDIVQIDMVLEIGCLINIKYWTFTLKNGKEKLSKKFNNIKMYEYKDSIKLTDENELIEWIFTSVVMQDLDKKQFNGLAEHFAKYKDEKGVLNIPKQIGCFVSIK